MASSPQASELNVDKEGAGIPEITITLMNKNLAVIDPATLEEDPFYACLWEETIEKKEWLKTIREQAAEVAREHRKIYQAMDKVTGVPPDSFEGARTQMYASITSRLNGVSKYDRHRFDGLPVHCLLLPSLVHEGSYSEINGYLFVSHLETLLQEKEDYMYFDDVYQFAKGPLLSDLIYHIEEHPAYAPLHLLQDLFIVKSIVAAHRYTGAEENLIQLLPPVFSAQFGKHTYEGDMLTRAATLNAKFTAEPLSSDCSQLKTYQETSGEILDQCIGIVTFFNLSKEYALRERKGCSGHYSQKDVSMA